MYGLGFREDLYYLIDASTCAKDANYNQSIRIARSLFYFPLKLIGADHGLHTSGGV